MIGLAVRRMNDVGNAKPSMWVGDWSGPSERARQIHTLCIATAAMWLQSEAAATSANWAVLRDGQVELWSTKPENLYSVPVNSFAADELIVATVLLGAEYKGFTLPSEGLSL